MRLGSPLALHQPAAAAPMRCARSLDLGFHGQWRQVSTTIQSTQEVLVKPGLNIQALPGLRAFIHRQAVIFVTSYRHQIQTPCGGRGRMSHKGTIANGLVEEPRRFVGTVQAGGHYNISAVEVRRSNGIGLLVPWQWSRHSLAGVPLKAPLIAQDRS